MYVKNADRIVKPEHREEYIRAIVDFSREAKLAGADRFDVMESYDDRNCIVTLQVWRDAAAYAAHHKAAGADFEQRVAPLLTEKARESEAKNIEPLDEEWDVAYEQGAQPRWAEFGPVYTHNTWIYIQPDKVDEAIRLVLDEVRIAKKMERGIIRFDVYQNLQNPALIHTYEVYADQDAHHFHYAQEYLKDLKMTGVLMFDESTYDQTYRGMECRQIEPTHAQWMGWEPST